ncbi:MAG TPA: NAD+ synthase [Thermodesulfobacteriaceae bacterium]|nr:NAD+ synthase [Thermodesulfobacteriaceae bacterium]
MKVGLAQINPTIGAFDENIAMMVGCAGRAREAGCDLVVFPEFALCGYPPQDLLERKDFIENSLSASRRLVSSVSGVAMLFGCLTPARYGKPLHNSAILCEDGRVLGEVHKRLLPSYDIFDETRYFKPGDISEPVLFRDIPLGITICEDMWSGTDLMPLHYYSCNPVADLAGKGARVFINLSCSPFDVGKMDVRRDIVRKNAVTCQSPFLYVNSVGGQDSLIFDGGSFVMTARGEIIAHAADFEEDFIAVDLDSMKGDIHTVTGSREEAVVKALEMGLIDYTRRCGISRVTLGLSGGVDSSVTAVLASRALGAENVLGVIMPSPYTSGASVEDAELLAANIGIRTITLPIYDIFKVYLDVLEPVFSGRKPDVAEENIQARIRGNLLMAISNKLGHMVLSTGNKSEFAVGYCTLYGDMSGGYALISDLPKMMVYDVARYLNSLEETIPERVLTRAPSAELRPDQSDQDDLPPYEVLDPILELYLEKNFSFDQIVGRGFQPDVVSTIIKMVDRSEYKRRQAPIGPRVTAKAFGIGRRYPIAHGYRRS